MALELGQAWKIARHAELFSNQFLVSIGFECCPITSNLNKATGKQVSLKHKHGATCKKLDAHEGRAFLQLLPRAFCQALFEELPFDPFFDINDHFAKNPKLQRLDQRCFSKRRATYDGIDAGLDRPVDILRVKTLSSIYADSSYIDPVGYHFRGIYLVTGGYYGYT